MERLGPARWRGIRKRLIHIHLLHSLREKRRWIGKHKGDCDVVLTVQMFTSKHKVKPDERLRTGQGWPASLLLQRWLGTQSGRVSEECNALSFDM